MKAIVLASLVVALAVLLAGCGGSSKNSSSAAPKSGQGGPPQLNQQAFAQLQQCLKDHGVTLPNGRPQGQPGQRPTLDSKTQKAFQACRQYLPSQPQGGGGFGGQGGPGF